MPERTAIEVYELGARIIPDAAILQFQCGSTDLPETNAWNIKINGLPFNVETTPDRPPTSFDQQGIVLGRSVGRDHVDFAATSH